MLDFILGFIEEFLQAVVNFLPSSPFQAFIDSCSNIPYLRWLNWFVPVGTLIAIGQAWLTAVGLYYMYSVILRWLRAIE